MADRFFTQKVVLFVIVCGLPSTTPDLLDLYKTSRNNPPELNDFLRDVLKHKRDFKWIRKAARELRDKDRYVDDNNNLDYPQFDSQIEDRQKRYEDHYFGQLDYHYHPRSDLQRYSNPVNGGKYVDHSRYARYSQKDLEDIDKKLEENFKRQGRMRRGLDLSDFSSDEDLDAVRVKIRPRSQSGVVRVHGKKYELLNENLIRDKRRGLGRKDKKKSARISATSPPTTQVNMNDVNSALEHEILGLKKAASDDIAGKNQPNAVRTNEKEKRSLKLNIIDDENAIAKIERNDKTNSIMLKLRDDNQSLKQRDAKKGAENSAEQISMSKERNEWIQQQKQMTAGEINSALRVYNQHTLTEPKMPPANDKLQEINEVNKAHFKNPVGFDQKRVKEEAKNYRQAFVNIDLLSNSPNKYIPGIMNELVNNNNQDNKDSITVETESAKGVQIKAEGINNQIKAEGINNPKENSAKEHVTTLEEVSQPTSAFEQSMLGMDFPSSTERASTTTTIQPPTEKSKSNKEDNDEDQDDLFPLQESEDMIHSKDKYSREELDRIARSDNHESLLKLEEMAEDDLPSSPHVERSENSQLQARKQRFYDAPTKAKHFKHRRNTREIKNSRMYALPEVRNGAEYDDYDGDDNDSKKRKREVDDSEFLPGRRRLMSLGSFWKSRHQKSNPYMEKYLHNVNKFRRSEDDDNEDVGDTWVGSKATYDKKKTSYDTYNTNDLMAKSMDDFNNGENFNFQPVNYIRQTAFDNFPLTLLEGDKPAAGDDSNKENFLKDTDVFRPQDNKLNELNQLSCVNETDSNTKEKEKCGGNILGLALDENKTPNVSSGDMIHTKTTDKFCDTTTTNTEHGCSENITDLSPTNTNTSVAEETQCLTEETENYTDQIQANIANNSKQMQRQDITNCTNFETVNGTSVDNLTNQTAKNGFVSYNIEKNITKKINTTNAVYSKNEENVAQAAFGTKQSKISNITNGGNRISSTNEGYTTNSRFSSTQANCTDEEGTTTANVTNSAFSTNEANCTNEENTATGAFSTNEKNVKNSGFSSTETNYSNEENTANGNITNKENIKSGAAFANKGNSTIVGFTTNESNCTDEENTTHGKNITNGEINTSEVNCTDEVNGGNTTSGQTTFTQKLSSNKPDNCTEESSQTTLNIQPSSKLSRKSKSNAEIAHVRYRNPHLQSSSTLDEYGHHGKNTINKLDRVNPNQSNTNYKIRNINRNYRKLHKRVEHEEIVHPEDIKASNVGEIVSSGFHQGADRDFRYFDNLRSVEKRKSQMRAKEWYDNELNKDFTLQPLPFDINKLKYPNKRNKESSLNAYRHIRNAEEYAYTPQRKSHRNTHVSQFKNDRKYADRWNSVDRRNVRHRTDMYGRREILDSPPLRMDNSKQADKRSHKDFKQWSIGEHAKGDAGPNTSRCLLGPEKGMNPSVGEKITNKGGSGNLIDESEEANPDSSCGQMRDAISGQLAVQLVDKVFNEVQGHNRLASVFGAGLCKSSKRKQQLCNIHEFIKNTTRENVKNTQDVLQQVMHGLNLVIMDQVRRRTCQRLAPQLHCYLSTITKVVNEKEEENENAIEGMPLNPAHPRGTHEEAMDGEQGDFLFFLPDKQPGSARMSVEKKIKVVRALLEKYNNMSDKVRTRVQPVKDYLEEHLAMLLEIQKRNNQGSYTTKASPRMAQTQAPAERHIQSSHKPEYHHEEIIPPHLTLTRKPPVKQKDFMYVPDQRMIDKQLESLGLYSQTSIAPNVDVDKVIEEAMAPERAAARARLAKQRRKIAMGQHRRLFKKQGSKSKNMKREAEENEEEENNISAWDGSSKYRKLVETADEMRRKRETEERLGELFGKDRKRSLRNERYPTIMSKNRDMQDFSNVDFETPIVMNLDN